MKPTKEQIEKYISAADDELGPECVDSWVEDIRGYLRAWEAQSCLLSEASRLLAECVNADDGEFQLGGDLHKNIETLLLLTANKET